jgi:hypothetical protein
MLAVGPVVEVPDDRYLGGVGRPHGKLRALVIEMGTEALPHTAMGTLVEVV